MAVSSSAWRILASLPGAALGVLSAGSAACTPAAPPPRPPNILILLADDLGWRDVGYHGGDIRTPAIDRLAGEGVRLERFYTAPICSPTRAGLLTGRYPIRFGMMRSVITPWSRYGLPAGERTLAEMLRDAGYARRAIVGKWHLGQAAREFHPLNQGFTHFYGHLTGSISYFSHKSEGALDWHRDWAISRDEGYSTDLIADEAVRQIEQGAAEEPFFLYVAFNAPHAPLTAKDEDSKRYPGLEGPRKTYAAMVDSLDQGIGRILAAVDAKGIAGRTLVLFASDNGADRTGDNRPLRGGKSDVYEGGIRVPAILRWPDGLPGPPREVDATIGYIDVYPTLKRVAGVTSPDPLPLDGRDVLDVIRGGAELPPREWYSFFARGRPERIAVNAGRWKLVVAGPSVLAPHARVSGRRELFDIEDDPGERRDVADGHPDVVRDLLERLRTFRRLQVPGVEPFAMGRKGFRPPQDWSIRE